MGTGCVEGGPARHTCAGSRSARWHSTVGIRGCVENLPVALCALAFGAHVPTCWLPAAPAAPAACLSSALLIPGSLRTALPRRLCQTSKPRARQHCNLDHQSSSGGTRVLASSELRGSLEVCTSSSATRARQRQAPGRTPSSCKRQAHIASPDVSMRMSVRIRSIALGAPLRGPRRSNLSTVHVCCSIAAGASVRPTRNLSVAVCFHCVGIVSGGVGRGPSMRMICSVMVRDIAPSEGAFAVTARPVRASMGPLQKNVVGPCSGKPPPAPRQAHS